MENFSEEKDVDQVDYLNGSDSNEDQKLAEYASYSKKTGIIVLVLWACVFTFFISCVVQLVWCVRTLTLNTSNRNLKSDATLWGIIGLFLLPIIPMFIMSSKANNYLSNSNLNN